MDDNTIDREQLAEIVAAGQTLCAFCESTDCEKCMVNILVNDAFAACPDADGIYEDPLDDLDEDDD